MKYPGMTLREVAAVALATVSITGVAEAAIPGPDGTVVGCYDPDTGNGSSGPLRPVDGPTACGPGELAVTFATRGAAGATGPPGAAGVRGATGDAGAPPQAPAVFESILAPGDTVTDPRATSVALLPKTPQKLTTSVDVGPGTYEIRVAAQLYGWSQTRVTGYAGGTARSFTSTTQPESATCFLNAADRELISVGSSPAKPGSFAVTDRATIVVDRPATLVFGCGADLVQRPADAPRAPRDGTQAVGDAGVMARELRITAVRIVDGTVTLSRRGLEAVPDSERAAAAQVLTPARLAAAIKAGSIGARAALQAVVVAVKRVIG